MKEQFIVSRSKEPLKKSESVEIFFYNIPTTLGTWTLWTHRNKCVFDGAASNITSALAVAEDEGNAWSLAGARGLSLLAAIASGG
jgi:hypothetical protein